MDVAWVLGWRLILPAERVVPYGIRFTVAGFGSLDRDLEPTFFASGLSPTCVYIDSGDVPNSPSLEGYEFLRLFFESIDL